MSEQRVPINVKISQAAISAEQSAAQAELDAAVERRKKLKEGLRVQLLERGQTSSALAIDLPPHIHGEWIRNEPLRIRDAKALGFEIDKEYAPKQAMHDARADGSAVVGDLVFMTCPKENKELIEEIRQEEYNMRHGKPGATNQKQAEERVFEANQGTLIGSHIGTVSESRATPVHLPVDKKEE